MVQHKKFNSLSIYHFHYESIFDVADIENSTMESISNVKKKVY